MSVTVMHGTWGRSRDSEWHFFLWGETAPTSNSGTRGRRPPSRHPFCASVENLMATSKVTSPPDTDVIELLLPTFTSRNMPQPSTKLLDLVGGGDDGGSGMEELTLEKWAVDCLAFTPADACGYLKNLGESSDSHDVRYGDDLLYWGKVVRFSLNLLARQRFIPGIESQQGSHNNRQRCLARWIPVMNDAADVERLKLLEASMPPACRALNGRIPPGQLLVGVLQCIIDALIRKFIAGDKPRSAGSDVYGETLGGDRDIATTWFGALFGANPEVRPRTKKHLEKLASELGEWSEAVINPDEQGGTKFITCLKLEPPVLQENGSDAEDDNDNLHYRSALKKTKWQLRYLLQASDDPSFLIEADRVWANAAGKGGSDRKIITTRYIDRRFSHPQDRLLGDLAAAARLFKPIERSLKSRAPSGCLLDIHEAHSFLTESAWLLRESGFGVFLPSWHNNARQNGLAVNITLKSKPVSKSGNSPAGSGMNLFGLDSLLDFDWRFAIRGKDGKNITVSEAEFRRLVSLKLPLVNIRGEWVELRKEEVESTLKLLESYKKNGGMPLGVALSLITGGVQQTSDEDHHHHLAFGFDYEGKEVEEVLSRLTGSDALSSSPLPPSLPELPEQPEGFNGILRDYQVRGYSWLHYLTRRGIGACLADDMGLGKTVQLIALLLLHLQGQKTRPWLIVCPTSLVGNWVHEINRFSPSVRVMVHHGAGRREGDGFVLDAKNHDLVISTYPLVQRDIDTVSKVRWGMIALDEAQNIKNHYAKQSRAIKSLEADAKIALTGTPVENRLQELWSIMDFLNPGYLGGPEEFRQRFSVPIERYGDVERRSQLQRLVRPFILRRVKTDPAIIKDLPEKMESKVYCSLTEEQATLYEAVVEHMMRSISDSEGIKRKGLVLSALTRLKQICDHPSLYLADKSANIDGRSGKLSRLKEMLEEIIASGENSLVFTQYAAMGSMLQEYIQSSLGCKTLFLHGGVPRKERDLMIKWFQGESSSGGGGGTHCPPPEGPRVFVLSLKAGGVGLNLTAANHVFHYDRWWNPAVENQATDRAYRIGQDKSVQVHKLISTGTLEEKIDEMIERKKDLAEGVIGSSEEWITRMNNDQLRELFALRREMVVAASS